MKKSVYIILYMIIAILSACSPVTDVGNPEPPEVSEVSIPVEEPETVLLISTDSLKVERQGSTTTICDLAGNRVHTLISRKIARKKTDPAPVSSVLIDTDTLKVEQLRGVVLIIEKSTNSNHLI